MTVSSSHICGKRLRHSPSCGGLQQPSPRLPHLRPDTASQPLSLHLVTRSNEEAGTPECSKPLPWLTTDCSRLETRNMATAIASGDGHVDRSGVTAEQSCQECRRRKAKCDRSVPTCGLCHQYRRHCVYEKHSRTPLTRKCVSLSSCCETLSRGRY